ncbi:MAG: adenosylcobinamide-GDP ribazoletransferase [Bacteroidetes bacterium]|nr:adenosylcobinamide-GDP ribazoletransferase [Bacteroidota bacterium]
MLKKEIRIFFTALMFFTRIPCPKWIDHSEEYLSKSSRYFPLIGIIVGGIGALVYYSFSFIFPHPIAILLSMVSTILVTGAFHEDGLADMCDGFGGGWTKQDILRIMKDSRTGTYGVVGLCSMLAIKFASLYYMDSKLIPLVLIAGHSLSRFAASTLLYTLDYVREDADSKAKPAAGRISAFSLCVGAVFGIISLALFFNYYVFALLVPVFIARWYLGHYYKKWIGGHTGDCGGATQQICEVVFYLSFIVLWKYI